VTALHHESLETPRGDGGQQASCPRLPNGDMSLAPLPLSSAGILGRKRGCLPTFVAPLPTFGSEENARGVRRVTCSGGLAMFCVDLGRKLSHRVVVPTLCVEPWVRQPCPGEPGVLLSARASRAGDDVAVVGALIGRPLWCPPRGSRRLAKRAPPRRPTAGPKSGPLALAMRLGATSVGRVSTSFFHVVEQEDGSWSVRLTVDGHWG